MSIVLISFLQVWSVNKKGFFLFNSTLQTQREDNLHKQPEAEVHDRCRHCHMFSQRTDTRSLSKAFDLMEQRTVCRFFPCFVAADFNWVSFRSENNFAISYHENRKLHSSATCQQTQQIHLNSSYRDAIITKNQHSTLIIFVRLEPIIMPANFILQFHKYLMHVVERPRFN